MYVVANSAVCGLVFFVPKFFSFFFSFLLEMRRLWVGVGGWGGVGHVTVTRELHGCADVLLRLGWVGWGGACYRYQGTSWLC